MKLKEVTFVTPESEWTIMIRGLYDRPIVVGPITIENGVIKICYPGSANHLVVFPLSAIKDYWPVVITSNHDVIVNGKSVTGELVQNGENLDKSRSELRVSEFDRISNLYVWDTCIEKSRAIILRGMADKMYKDHLRYKKAPPVEAKVERKEDGVKLRRLYEQAGF